MKHRSLSLALCVLLLVFLCAPALAADTDYTGPLDPETGQPKGEADPQSSDSRPALSDTMYYDWNTHDFAYPISDTLGEVHSNAADGMVLTTPVTLTVSGDIPLSIYRNGSEYTGDRGRIAEVGGYTVSASVNGQSRRLLSFTLVGKTTNAVHTFLAPDGFYIREATRDGEPIYADRYSVSMEEEGAYIVEYECSATDVVYKLETTIDRTPPALTLEGRADGQGRLRSALKFRGLQTGDGVYLTRFGEYYPPKLSSDGSGEVTDAGNYTMLVFDSAGNTVECNFVILQYYNMQSWVFFLLVFLVLAGVIAYIIVKRKRLKIA